MMNFLIMQSKLKMPVTGNVYIASYKRTLNQCFLLIGGVVTFSYCNLLGILFHYEILKWVGTAIWLASLWLSFKIILVNRNRLKTTAIIPLFIFFLIPVIRILMDCSSEFSFKKLTDGIIIYGSYYELAVVGLALTLLTRRVSIKELLAKYRSNFFWIAIISSIGVFIVISRNQENILLGQKVITEFLILFSLLLLIEKKPDLRSVLSLFLVIFMASSIASRSYIIVGLLLAITVFLNFLNRGSYKWILFAFVIFIMGSLFNAFSFLEKGNLVQNIPISEKFHLSTLLERVGLFLNSGDFMILYEWEGNSRQVILSDAFGGFTFQDILFGKGIFGSYESFVDRSTIEMGWAQEAFRWGGVTVFLEIWIVLFSLNFLKKKMKNNHNELLIVLFPILLIRFIDSFIYGIPIVSVYNLIFYLALFYPFVHHYTIEDSY